MAKSGEERIRNTDVALYLLTFLESCKCLQELSFFKHIDLPLQMLRIVEAEESIK